MSDSPERCACATHFEVTLGRTTDYRRCKRILDRAHFPAFVGRDTVRRSAQDGGLLFFTYEGEDAAVAVMNARNSTALALAVLPTHQGHGLGSAIVEYARPNFRRVTTEFVPYFQARGYSPIGEPKQGRKFATQIMVRTELLGLAGRVSRVLGDADGSCSCADPSHDHAGR